MSSNYSSDTSTKNADLFITELIKWTVSFNSMQQSKLVQKEALIEKCAKSVKYIDQRGIEGWQTQFISKNW